MTCAGVATACLPRAVATLKRAAADGAHSVVPTVHKSMRAAEKTIICVHCVVLVFSDHVSDSLCFTSGRVIVVLSCVFC